MKDSLHPLLLPLPLLKMNKEIRLTQVGEDKVQVVLVVIEKTSVLLVMKVHTLGRTVNTMMATEEVEDGTKQMEAQVHKNNHGGENMEEVAEELGMGAVMEVVVEKKSKMESAAVALAPAPGDAMAARRSTLSRGLSAKVRTH